MDIRTIVEEIEMEGPESADSATLSRPMISELRPDGLEGLVGRGPGVGGVPSTGIAMSTETRWKGSGQAAGVSWWAVWLERWA